MEAINNYLFREKRNCNKKAEIKGRPRASKY